MEIEYYKSLKAYVNEIKKYTREELLPALKKLQSRYIADSYADDLKRIFENMQVRFASTAPLFMASSIVKKVEKINAERTARTLNASLGIDVSGLLQTEGIQAFTEAQIAKNAQLIKSIPQEFQKQIETIVYNGVTSGQNYTQIAKQIAGRKDISSVFGKLDNRVKLIARNERSTINAQITKKRQEELGIKRAVWRTSDDERVRPCHAIRNGKEYDISKGLYSSCDGKTLFPGEEINCRCIAIPKIEV